MTSWYYKNDYKYCNSFEEQWKTWKKYFIKKLLDNTIHYVPSELIPYCVYVQKVKHYNGET